jgi:hypothetical protein
VSQRFPEEATMTEPLQDPDDAPEFVELETGEVDAEDPGLDGLPEHVTNPEFLGEEPAEDVARGGGR